MDDATRSDSGDLYVRVRRTRPPGREVVHCFRGWPESRNASAADPSQRRRAPPRQRRGRRVGVLGTREDNPLNSSADPRKAADEHNLVRPSARAVV